MGFWDLGFRGLGVGGLGVSGLCGFGFREPNGNEAEGLDNKCRDRDKEKRVFLLGFCLGRLLV